MKKQAINIIPILMIVIASAQTPESQIDLYPNPFADSITYKATLNYGDSMELQLFDLQGQLKLQQEKQPYYQSKKISLMIDDLDDGVYLASITVDRTTQRKKIIKNGVINSVRFDLDVAVVSLIPDELVVYPNPANSEVTIVLRVNDGPAKVSVYTLGGKKLLDRNFENSTNPVRWNLDVSDLLSGTYLIRLESKNGTLFKRLLKAN